MRVISGHIKNRATDSGNSKNNNFSFVSPSLNSTKATIVDFSNTSSKSIINKINKLDSGSLVLIDNKTLSNKSAMEAIKDSRAKFCIKSPTGINRLRNALNSQLNELEIIVLTPKTKKEVKNVFGVEGDDAHLILKQMQKTEKYFKEIDNTTIVKVSSSNETMADMISRQILENSGKKKTYLIVGHNENGKLKFPDGSTSTIGDIYKKLSASDQYGIVLSCQTIDSSTTATSGVFTTRRLEFENIAMSIQKTANWAKDGEPKTVGDFTVMLELSLKEYDDKKQRNIKIVYASATGTGSFVVAAFIFVITDD